jgi:hypothetical protein
VLREPLDNIWNSERYRAFRRMLRMHGLFAQCARCCVLSRHNWVARLLPRLRIAAQFGRAVPHSLYGETEGL